MFRKFSTDQINDLKTVISIHRHGNYIPLNKSTQPQFHFDLELHLFIVAYQFGCSLSTIRREWRNIDPDVRRGQWQVDEDEVQTLEIF